MTDLPGPGPANQIALEGTTIEADLSEVIENTRVLKQHKPCHLTESCPYCGYEGPQKLTIYFEHSIHQLHAKTGEEEPRRGERIKEQRIRQRCSCCDAPLADIPTIEGHTRLLNGTSRDGFRWMVRDKTYRPSQY